MAGAVVQRIAAKAIVVNDDKVLVLREAASNPDGANTGKYDVPGGRLEPGEPFFDALRREVREETGIDELEIGEPFFVGEWTPLIKGVKTQIVALFVICRPKESSVQLSREHDAYDWVTESDLKDIAIMDATAEAIRRYFKRR